MITLAVLTVSAQEQKPRHSRKPYLGAISKEPPSSFSFQCFEFALETPLELQVGRHCQMVLTSN